VPSVISHFQVESLLGAGGMGTVYLGVDRRDGTLVAIKLLHPHLTDPSFKERFEREAHVAALLRSPYTVHILDYGIVDGRYFIAMEYVDGDTLGQALREGPLPVDRALRIAAQVARALEEAQARGVVHRDIKPENILLRAGDAVKVSDFGIARQAGAATLTVPGAFYGTLSYAAPEQFRGEADHRSDIYAVGATLYHMLAGRPPFSGSFEEVQMQIMEEPLALEPLGGLDDTVVQIASRCLEKEPERRYQSASELAAALERAARGSTAPPAEQPRRAPSAPTEALGTAAAAGREALSMRLGPPRAGFPFTPRLRSLKYDLAIQNECGEQLDLELRAEDRGGRCRFKLPKKIIIGPHSALRLSLWVRPKKRRWRGDREVRVFTVYASIGDGQPPFTVTGRFDDMAYGWLPAGGVLSLAGAAAVAGGLLFGGVMSSDSSQEPLKIGLLMPFSGLRYEGGPSWEETGPAYLNAARIAVGEINADGGVLGRPVVLVQGDTAGDSNVGIPEARRLVEGERVQAIIGDVNVTSSLDIANKVTGPGRVVHITPNAIAEEATVDLQGQPLENDPLFLFKTEVKPEAEGVALAQLVTGGGYRTVCSIFADSEATVKTNERLKESASGAEIIEVQHSSEVQGSTPEEMAAFFDQTAATEIEQCAGADAIVLSVFPDVAPLPGQVLVTSYLLKEALERGLGPILLSSHLAAEAGLSPEESGYVFDEIGWDRVASVKGTRAGQAEESQGDKFDETYRLQFGEPPLDLQDASRYPADLRTVYDAVYLIALAAQRAGSTDPDAIRNALPEVANTPGAVIKPGPIGRGPYEGGGFKKAVDLIAEGEDIDYEGAAGPIEFNADRDNVRGAIEIWHVDRQASALVTEQTLIVDLGAGQAAPPAAEEVTSSTFVVPVTLTAGPGFEVVEDQNPRDLALYRERSQYGPDAYLSFLSPASLFNGEPLPSDLITWLESKEGVEVAEAKDVTIGGLPATQIDVKGDADGTGLFDMGETKFVLVPGERARFVVLEVNGEPIVIAGGPLGWGQDEDPDAVFQDVAPDLEAMLATVQFE